MKKVTLIIMLLMAFAMVATAQNKKMKIAVMDFKAGVGVNANEVEGLSDMLINTMYESGKFSIVERSQIDQVLKEWKFQASELTNEQLVQVGRILGVESVLVGTVNLIASEYNVDVRAVDVESGEVVTTAGGTKSPGSTYRAMMEKIARQLAENLTGEKTVEVVPRKGFITKGSDFYYLDGQRLTNMEYIELIQNCPEAWMNYEKGCNLRKTGSTILIVGGAIVVGGIVTAVIGSSTSPSTLIAGLGVVGGGSTIAIASIPFLFSGKSKKENAYQVYNEYCAKRPATLSFGPATQGIGMGVYLNF